jgi:hypothetical protein
MEMERLRIWIDVGQFVLMGAVSAYVYWTNRAQARAEVLERMERRLDQRLDELDLRLTRIDAGVHNAPSLEVCAAHRGRVDMIERLMSERPGHEDMKRVHARIDEVSTIVGEVRGRLTGIEHSLEMITQHLLDQSVRGGA